MSGDLNAIAKLSIGMPVWNSEQFVRRAIEAILSQSFTDFELIISDNASTDSTQEICEAYAASDARTRYDKSGAPHSS